LLARLKKGKVSELGTLIVVFMARRTWAGEQVVHREGLDIGNLLSFSSAFTKGVEIPENGRVKCVI
jgi:hypothetical protein